MDSSNKTQLAQSFSTNIMNTIKNDQCKISINEDELENSPKIFQKTFILDKDKPSFSGRSTAGPIKQRYIELNPEVKNKINEDLNTISIIRQTNSHKLVTANSLNIDKTNTKSTFLEDVKCKSSAFKNSKHKTLNKDQINDNKRSTRPSFINKHRSEKTIVIPAQQVETEVLTKLKISQDLIRNIKELTYSSPLPESYNTITDIVERHKCVDKYKKFLDKNQNSFIIGNCSITERASGNIFNSWNQFDRSQSNRSIKDKTENIVKAQKNLTTKLLWNIFDKPNAKLDHEKTPVSKTLEKQK